MTIKRKPHVIKDLHVTEVSLVDRPANQHAHVLLSKRDVAKGQPNAGDAHQQTAAVCDKCKKTHTGECAQKKNYVERAKDFLKRMFVDSVEKRPTTFNAVLATSSLWELNSALDTALRSALNDSATDDEALAAVGTALSQFNTAVIDLVSAGLSGEGPDLMPDAGASSGDYNTEKGMTKAEKEAAAEKLRKQLAELEKEVPTDDTPAGAGDSTTHVQLSKMETENKELRERLAKVEEENTDRKLLDEATALVGKSGVDPKKIAKLLKKGDDESRTIIKEILGQTAEFAKSAKLFESIGSEEDGTIGAAQELEKIVKKLRADDPKLTKEQAVTKAYELYPELYDESDESDADEDIEDSE